MAVQMELESGAGEATPKKRGGKPRKSEAVSGMLTRVQVSRALGISVSGVRKLEGAKLPVCERDGVHLFDARDVESFRVRRTVKGPMPDGAIAAEVFGLIDGGIKPVEIVKRLHVHPDVVEQFVRQHARMSGAIVLGPDELGALVRASKLEASSLTTTGDVVRLMSDAVERAHLCVKCGDSTARFCGECSSDAATPRVPRSGARSRHA